MGFVKLRRISQRLPAGLTIALVLSLALLSGCSRRPAPPIAAEVSSAQPVLITMFYAYPANPPAGEKVSLCYGVENATEVRLQPAVERVWPSLSRCFEIPSKAETYTLTAERGSEHVSQTVTVQLGAPKAHIVEVSINKLDFNYGEDATVCYKAQNAVGVTIKPGIWIEPHRPDLGCVRDRLHKTTTYTVTATGVGGDTDSERVTARIK
jgi:hypothetical protein